MLNRQFLEIYIFIYKNFHIHHRNGLHIFCIDGGAEKRKSFMQDESVVANGGLKT